MERNPNKAVLPKGLSKDIFKLYLISVSFGCLLIGLGSQSVATTKVFLHMMWVILGLATVGSGLCGVMARWRRSVALHVATGFTYLVALGLGLLNYSILTKAMISDPSFSLAVQYDHQFGVVIEVCIIIVLALNVVMTGLVVGVEAGLVWVAIEQQKLWGTPLLPYKLPNAEPMEQAIDQGNKGEGTEEEYEGVLSEGEVRAVS